MGCEQIVIICPPFKGKIPITVCLDPTHPQLPCLVKKTAQTKDVHIKNENVLPLPIYVSNADNHSPFVSGWQQYSRTQTVVVRDGMEKMIQLELHVTVLELFTLIWIHRYALQLVGSRPCAGHQTHTLILPIIVEYSHASS